MHHFDAEAGATPFRKEKNYIVIEKDKLNSVSTFRANVF
jgi:hypothetical protein